MLGCKIEGNTLNKNKKNAENFNNLRLFSVNFGFRYYATASVLVPQSAQNFAPGSRSFWQLEHLAFSFFAPHSLQNFAPSRSSAPHLIQGTLAISIFAPQSEQNFTPDAFCFPHEGHGTNWA